MGFCDEVPVQGVHGAGAEPGGVARRTGIHLVKLWFSCPVRSSAPVHDPGDRPLRQWKLSPVDLGSLDKWDDYTRPRRTCSSAPTAVRPVDRGAQQRQKRGRIEALRWVLAGLDYPTKDLEVVGTPDPLIVGPPAQVYEQSELDTRASNGWPHSPEPGLHAHLQQCRADALACASRPVDRVTVSPGARSQTNSKPGMLAISWRTTPPTARPPSWRRTLRCSPARTAAGSPPVVGDQHDRDQVPLSPPGVRELQQPAAH